MASSTAKHKKLTSEISRDIRFFEFKASPYCSNADLINEIGQKKNIIKSMCLGDVNFKPIFEAITKKNNAKDDLRRQTRKIMISNNRSKYEISKQNMQFFKLKRIKECINQDKCKQTKPFESEKSIFVVTSKDNTENQDSNCLRSKNNLKLSFHSHNNLSNKSDSMSYATQNKRIISSLKKHSSQPSILSSFKLHLKNMEMPKKAQKTLRKVGSCASILSRNNEFGSVCFSNAGSRGGNGLNYNLSCRNSFTPLGKLKLFHSIRPFFKPEANASPGAMQTKKRNSSYWNLCATPDDFDSKPDININTTATATEKSERISFLNKDANLRIVTSPTTQSLNNALISINTGNISARKENQAEPQIFQQNKSRSISKHFKNQTQSNLKLFISNFKEIESSLKRTKLKMSNSISNKFSQKMRGEEQSAIEVSESSLFNGKYKKQRILNSDPNEFDFLEYLQVKVNEPELTNKYLLEKVKINNKSSLVDHNFISNDVARVVTYGNIVSKMDNIKVLQMGKSIKENYLKYSKQMLPNSLAMSAIEKIKSIKVESLKGIIDNSRNEKIMKLNLQRKLKDLLQK